MSQPLKQVFVPELWSERNNKREEKVCLCFCQWVKLSLRLLALLRLLFFFPNYQQSNQEIGDPAVAVTRPCLDGIKSNTSLMPQPLFATAPLLCVGLRVCSCVYELHCDCNPPLRISPCNPAVGEVTQSSGRIRVKTAGVDFVKLLRTTLLIWGTGQVAWPNKPRFSLKRHSEQNCSRIRFGKADESWLTVNSFWVGRVAKTTTLNWARL